MPRAFFIGQFDIHDPEGYAVYRSQTAATLAPFGGRFVVRGGRLQTFEGEAPLPRVVVIEFPSFDQAKAWYQSSRLSEIDSDPPEGRERKVVPGRGRGGVAQTPSARSPFPSIPRRFPFLVPSPPERGRGLG